MAVLMSAGGAAGGPNGGTRRCDGTCHNAKKPTCVCICGGRYHGKGTTDAFKEHVKDTLDGVWGEEMQRVARTVQAARTSLEGQTFQPLVFQREVAAGQQAIFTFV